MIKYDKLEKRFGEIAPRVPEQRRLDWLENTEVVVSNDLDKREIFSNEEERDRAIEKGIRSHLNKLKGISGGEIGPLYLNFIGQYSFRTAEEIVREKLASKYPEARSGHIDRGMMMRDEIEKRFLISMKNHKLRPFGYESSPSDTNEKSSVAVTNRGMTKDAYALEQMFGEYEDKIWDDHPWVRKALNSKLYLDKFGELWLVKFTCPSEHDNAVSMADSVPEDYKAQMCLDKIKLEEAFRRVGENLQIEHTLIVPFSTKLMEPLPVEFDIDPIMESTVMDAGDHYWDNVLNQKIPKFVSPYKFEYIHEVPENLAKLNADFIFAKKMESKSKALAESLKNAIEEHAARFGVNVTDEGHKTRFGGVDLTTGRKISLNEEKLKDLFIEMGGNIEDELYWDVTIKPKVTDMKRFIKEKEGDVSACMMPGTKKTDPALLQAEYKRVGGEENDETYYKITRKLDMKLLQSQFLLMGGDLKDEKINDSSVQPSITVIRKKESGHQVLIDKIEEVVEEIFSEGIEYMPEVIQEHINITSPDNPSHPDVIVSGETVERETESLPEEKFDTSKMEEKINMSKGQALTANDELDYF